MWAYQDPKSGAYSSTNNGVMSTTVNGKTYTMDSREAIRKAMGDQAYQKWVQGSLQQQQQQRTSYDNLRYGNDHVDPASYRDLLTNGFRLGESFGWPTKPTQPTNPQPTQSTTTQHPATTGAYPTHVQTQVTTPHVNNRMNYLMQGMQGVPGFNNGGAQQQPQQFQEMKNWNSSDWSAPQQSPQNSGFGGYGMSSGGYGTPSTQQTNPYIQTGQNPYMKQNTVVF